MTTISPIRDTIYMGNQFTVERLPDNRFRFEGNWSVGTVRGDDHFQLIYEALEIAAASNDKFKETFRKFGDELLEKTVDWET
jgi:hypothetical protein